MAGTKHLDLNYSAKIALYIWMEASLCLEGVGREFGGGGGRAPREGGAILTG
jgi:hypothetical protein